MQIQEMVDEDGFQLRRVVNEWSLDKPLIMWMESYSKHITDEFVSIDPYIHEERERIYNLEQNLHTGK